MENKLLELIKDAIKEYGTQNIELRLDEDNETFQVYYCDLHEGYPVYETNIFMDDISDMDKLIENVEALGIEYFE